MSWPRTQQSSNLTGALTWNEKMLAQPRELPLRTLVAGPQVHQPTVHQAAQLRQPVAAQPQRDHRCHRQLQPRVPWRLLLPRSKTTEERAARARRQERPREKARATVAVPPGHKCQEWQRSGQDQSAMPQNVGRPQPARPGVMCSPQSSPPGLVAEPPPLDGTRRWQSLLACCWQQQQQQPLSTLACACQCSVGS